MYRSRDQMGAIHSFISVTLLLLLLSLHSDFTDASDMSVLAGPPERPDDFKNPAELREYLKALNDYFSLVGRPRSPSDRPISCH